MSSRSWETILGARRRENDEHSAISRNAGGHSGVITALSWSPCGNWLISGCSNCFGNVWSTSSYELLHIVGCSEHDTIHRITSIEWSPGGERFAIVFDTCVKFWNVSNFTLANRLHTGGDTKRMMWTSDSKLIITMSSHGISSNNICIWSDTTYELVFKISQSNCISYHSFALSVRGKEIAYSCRNLKEGKYVECCFVAKIGEKNLGNIVRETMRKSSEPFSQIDWSPCGKFISSVHSNTVCILVSSSLLTKIKRKTKCSIIISSSWTPCGKFYACLSVNNMRVIRNNMSYIDFFNTDARTSATETLKCYRNTVKLEWLSCGKRFITATDDSSIQIWDTATREIIISIEGNHLLLNCFSWIACGGMIAVGGNDRIIIWKTMTNRTECIATILFREMSIDSERTAILRKCPQCRKEVQLPFGYRGYPNNPISCCICYEEFSPIMMTLCGHFLCEVCFRNPLVFGYGGANVVDDLANSMIGVILSPRAEEYIQYDIFPEVFVIYGRYPNSPESRDRNETMRRKDVIIEALRKHTCDPFRNRISAQIVMDITFYCDPPRVDYPLGFMSPDEQTTQSFRRSVSMVSDIPNWQSAIISLYSDLMRRYM